MTQENGECMKPVVRRMDKPSARKGEPSAMPRFLLTIIAISFVARALAQTYIIQSNVTDSNGNVVATATTRFTAGTTQSAPAPIVVVPPTTQLTPGESPGAKSLPVMPGQTYASDDWLASFPKDGNGFVDLTSYIPANACIISLPATPGHLASDYGDFTSAQNAAVANGSICILFRDGGVYSASVVDNNVCGATGRAAHPFIISRIGPKGFLDHSLPRPVLLNGIGIAGAPSATHAWGAPIHYVILDGLDFYADQRDPSSPTYNKGNTSQTGCITMVDQSWGAASDHILIEDCRGRFFQKMIDIESAQAYAMNTVIVRRCVCAFNYGVFFGCYDYHVHDLLVVDSLFDNNGWNATAAPKNDPQGREHDWYTAINPAAETTDPQHRYVNDLFARADSEGLEGDAGGLCDSCLFLANPIAGYLGVYQSLFNNVVVDGGGGEFDNEVAGSALSLVPGNAGASRGWGVFLDCCPTGGMTNVTVINKANDAINSGFAVGVHVQDPAKQLVTLATAATLNGVMVHNWFEWNSTPGVSGPNAVDLDPPPAATITYSGCYLPGVIGVAGVTGTVPNYVDPTRTASSYAKSLGILGVTNGPTLLSAMDNQWSGNWNANLDPAAVVNWIQAGFQVNQ
jgi:hypothetical protein